MSGCATCRSRLACAAANMKIMGAAAGSIMAAIITVHTARKAAAPASDHPSAAIPAIAMPAIPSIPSIPPRTAIPMGISMLKVW